MSKKPLNSLDPLACIYAQQRLIVGFMSNASYAILHFNDASGCQSADTSWCRAERHADYR